MTDQESTGNASMPSAGAKWRNCVASGVAAIALAAALALPSSPPALATDAQPPMPYTAVIDGRRIESMGLVPGVTPAQARDILTPMGFVEKDRDEKEMSWKQDGVAVWRTPGFVSEVIFHKPGAMPVEEVVTEFTSTISGNQLVGVTWSLDWSANPTRLNWDLKAAGDFMVKTWGMPSNKFVPTDRAYPDVFWYRFQGGKVAACPTTRDGYAETCGEGGNFGGPHTLDRYKRFSDVLMRVAIWSHEGRVLRFEHTIDDFQRRDHALAMETAEVEAKVKHALAGGDKPSSKPKPAFTGIKVPTDVKVKEEGKVAPVENIPTGKGK